MPEVVVDVEPCIVYAQFGGRIYPLPGSHLIMQLAKAAPAIEHDLARLQPGEYCSIEGVRGYRSVKSEQPVKRLRCSEVKLGQTSLYGCHSEEEGHRHLRQDYQKVVVAGGEQVAGGCRAHGQH